QLVIPGRVEGRDVAPEGPLVHRQEYPWHSVSPSTAGATPLTRVPPGLGTKIPLPPPPSRVRTGTDHVRSRRRRLHVVRTGCLRAVGPLTLWLVAACGSPSASSGTPASSQA